MEIKARSFTTPCPHFFFSFPSIVFSVLSYYASSKAFLNGLFESFCWYSGENVHILR